MSTFVLIHGAWHGGWCWHKVTPRLEAAGRTVHVLDLPGHGIDDYADRVGTTLEGLDTPAIVVGHSMGGAVLSMVAERFPDRVARAVYLAAFLLEDGQTVLEVAESDADALAVPNFQIDEAAGTCTIADAALEEVFYADCSTADRALCRSLLRPESLAAFSTAMSLTDDGFGGVPRTYIETVADNAISIGVQREMHDGLACDPVYSLETSHSPFLSAPEALADRLLDAAPPEARPTRPLSRHVTSCTLLPHLPRRGPSCPTRSGSVSPRFRSARHDGVTMPMDPPAAAVPG